MKRQKERFWTVVCVHVHLCLALSTQQTLYLDIGSVLCSSLKVINALSLGEDFLCFPCLDVETHRLGLSFSSPLKGRGFSGTRCFYLDPRRDPRHDLARHSHS